MDLNWKICPTVSLAAEDFLLQESKFGCYLSCHGVISAGSLECRLVLGYVFSWPCPQSLSFRLPSFWILGITPGNIPWLTLSDQYLTAVSKWKHDPGAPLLSLCSASAGAQEVCFNGGVFLVQLDICSECAECLHTLQLVKPHLESLS